MTSLTTVLGMVPMAMGIGEGSETWQPMGIAVVGGLLMSTLLTLFIVPSLYAMLQGRKERKAARKARREAEEIEFIKMKQRQAAEKAQQNN
jgi:predicted RND superfamily exporter protein